MLATPLHDYYDNPGLAFEFLKSLDEHDTHFYTLGYIQSCNHIREVLTDMKSKFLNAAMSAEDDHARFRLALLTKALDLIEDSLTNRITDIEEARNADV